MSNVSLYRKYRPTTFNDVVGQDNVVKILENAINNNRISHAYLFNGPRGTGKTSIAKIFAKKASCTCSDNTCKFCQMNYDDGDIADIWEIDAASNNGVDEVRSIVENVSYMPIQMRYKVYIIDEVHMLTKGAFNALLKTLEEPPKHVIFILATTEIHKIPLTIISRCQRFDFKRISEEELVKRMITVLDAEQIEYEIEGLKLIAKLADGGMRDALSLVDKVSVYSKQISKDNVNVALQLVNDDEKQELLDLIIAKDIESVINCWKKILSMGIDENKFIIDMQYFVRDLMLAVVRGENPNYNIQDLLFYLNKFSELDSRLMYTKNYSIVIEVFLIEMCTNIQTKVVVQEKIENTIDINSHLEKLKQQTEMLENEKIQFQKEDFTNQEIINEFSEQVVQVKPQVVLEDPGSGITQKIDFVKSDFMTPRQVIKSENENQPEIVEVIEPQNQEPKVENTPIEFDLTNFHEEFEHDHQQEEDYSNECEPEMMIEPVIEDIKEPVEFVAIKTVVEDSEYNQICILDVLKSATHEHKEEFVNLVPTVRSQLEEKRQFGLAKFFDYCKVTAVGSMGMVITMDKSLFDTYSSRISEIEDLIYKENNKIGKVFLMEENDWLAKRPKFVEQIKSGKVDDANDIFTLAKNTFGDTLIKKI